MDGEVILSQLLRKKVGELVYVNAQKPDILKWVEVSE